MSEQIPEGWEEVVLKDILVTIENGSRPQGGADFESGEVPSLGGENIFQEGGVKYRPVKLIPEKFFKSLTKGILQDKDVLINKDGANTGKTGLYSDKPYKRAAINEHLFILRGNQNKITQEYLYFTFISEDGNRQIKDRITGSAQPGLNSQFTKAFKVLKPKSIKEQQKIAHILLTIDKTIDKTKDLIEKHKKIKQGLMRDLFEQISDCDTISFNDRRYVLLITKGTTPTTYGYNFTEEGVNFIKVESISDDGHFIKSQFQHINQRTNSFLKRSQLKEDDILFSIAGALGRCAQVNKSVIPANVNQALAIIRLRNGINTKYVKFVLDSYIIQEHIKKITVQLAQANLSLENISKFQIPFPDSNKQNKIVSIIMALNQRMETEESYLSKLTNIKTGLMQDLLTGKVRVKVEAA